MPTTTPLTDAINALTTYSNTVTGASDTTLSDAVATLAAGYGGGGSTSLYPLTFTDGRGHTQELSNSVTAEAYDSHIKITFGSTISSSYFYINLTDFISSTAAPTSINGRSKWFDLPPGSLIHTVSNVSNQSGITWNANFRNLSNSSLNYGIGDGTHETGETVTATVPSTESVGCYFLYIVPNTITANAVLEFDTSLTVNGIRYF